MICSFLVAKRVENSTDRNYTLINRREAIFQIRMFIHPSNMPISTAKCKKKQGERIHWQKLAQPARKLAQMASMRLRIFITMNLSCVGILFFFQCGGCDAVLQLRHQSTIGRPLQHHQVFSISYFPLFINLFHCVCLISVHVCLLVDLQTEVVLGVT